MSVCSNCPSDDVLSKIFQTLDVPDLLSCTKVCMKWRRIIESFVLGRRFFQRRKKSSAAWRRAWRKLALDETNLKPEDYKNICWSCLQYLEQVDGNWRDGIYKLKTSRYASYWQGTTFAVGEDFISAVNSDEMNTHDEKVQIFDRESVELKREFRHNWFTKGPFQIIDMNTVAYIDNNFELVVNDTNTGQLIRRSKLNDRSFFSACCPRAKLWTVETCIPSYSPGQVFRHALWRVDNASNVTVIKTIEVEHPDHVYIAPQVDEQFILHQHKTCDSRRKTFHFISTGLVHNTGLERSLSLMNRRSFHYDQSLMFFIKDQLIRILDVVSGTYLHDIHMGQIGTIKTIKVNLNYVVIIDRSNVYVYSLQALRNPLPSDAFVFKKECRRKIIAVAVDDTQIVLMFKRYQITVLDFGSFDPTPIPTQAVP
jgi:F-box-like